MTTLTVSELSLLVIAGLASATYAKSEGCSNLVAALIGVGASLVIYLLTH